MRGVGLVALMLLAVGCIATPPPVYAVQRSALVQHPAPPAWSGTPLRGRVQFEASNSTFLVPVEPEETDGANAGLFVARSNFGGALRFRVGSDLALKLTGSWAPEKRAMQINDTSLGQPEGGVQAFGGGFEYSARMSGPWRLGFGAELSQSRNPYRELGTCIQNCAGVSDYTEEGRHSVMIYSASLIPAYDTGNVVLFGGLTVRNHPTNTRKERQVGMPDDDMDELRGGPGYYLLGAGVEVRAGRHLSFVGHVFQPVSTDVARYGPAVGFAIRGELYDPEPRYSRAQMQQSLAR